MIAPSHGIIWRDNPAQIIEKYMNWAKDYQENQITIVYDTMWNATRRMAEAIAEGIRSVDKDVAVKLFNVSHADKNDVITEIFKSKAVLAGSSTVNRSIMFAIAGLLDMIKGMGFKNKKAAAFGSYGWSGESVAILNERLNAAKFEVSDGIKELWNPDEEAIKRCIQFGVDFAGKL
jgi:flavorubredoxin